MSTPERRTVDLSGYPDLVVIYLGLRLNAVRGLKYLAGLGPQIKRSVDDKPAGLLLHEDLIYGLFPPHIGMRQYWRDYESLEAWTHSDPHRIWWREFLKDTRGTGVWHETYLMRGGMEAIYSGLPKDVGMLRFAPIQPARGTMFSARRRANISDHHAPTAPFAEDEIYRS